MKKKTKNKILDTSLSLFNERGMSNVTLRQIAKEMKISQGNLNYHFRKRSDIINALYQQLVEKINLVFKQMEDVKSGIGQMMLSAEKTFRLLQDYRFILTDFVHIMREEAEIKAHFIALRNFRNDQFQRIFQHMLERGNMIPEAYPGQWIRLILRINLLGDFWISSAEILDNELDKEEQFQKYYSAIMEELYPYMSPKAQRALLNDFGIQF